MTTLEERMVAMAAVRKMVTYAVERRQDLRVHPDKFPAWYLSFQSSVAAEYSRLISGIPTTPSAWDEFVRNYSRQLRVSVVAGLYGRSSHPASIDTHETPASFDASLRDELQRNRNFGLPHLYHRNSAPYRKAA